MFLGIDGGGTKTAFALVDAGGAIRATHEESSAYHIEVGIDGAAAALARGAAAVLAAAGVDADALEFAFFGLPAYGEDRAAQAALDALPQAFLGHSRYLCGNDMVCSWAGALACNDGISVIAGTGSMAYGEYAGRTARAGGWGELFSDEGSAYWIAREGLTLFSRMSDGRAARGPLYDLVRRRFALGDDLDLCGVVYGDMNGERSSVAQLARLVGDAARGGDVQARIIFEEAAEELADMVDAVRASLGVADAAAVRVSYTGGVFNSDGLLLEPFRRALAGRDRSYLLAAPQLSPAVGAALYAARCAGSPLGAAALARLHGIVGAPAAPHPFT
jgi:N-acetylglucosamine kinase-like BadF-type ATPase